MRSFSYALLNAITFIFTLSLWAPLMSMDDPRISARDKYWEEKRLLEPMGFVIGQPDSEGNFKIHFPPLRRTRQDIETLRSWGFTDDDIQKLTIQNIHDPLNDPRILAAHRPDLGRHELYRFTFRIFASRLLLPIDPPSEADMLLLIPILQRIDADGDDLNLKLPHRTLFHTAVRNNYSRVIELLLANPDVNINSGDGTQTPLEAAIQNTSYHIVRLILNSGRDITVTDLARQMVESNKPIKEALQEYLEKRRKNSRDPNTSIATKESSSGGSHDQLKRALAAKFSSVCNDDTPRGVPPLPEKIFGKHLKKHRAFIAAAEGRGDRVPTEPPHHSDNSMKSVIGWTLSVPVLAAIIKYGNDFYEKYYVSKKKETAAQEH